MYFSKEISKKITYFVRLFALLAFASWQQFSAKAALTWFDEKKENARKIATFSFNMLSSKIFKTEINACYGNGHA